MQRKKILLPIFLNMLFSFCISAQQNASMVRIAKLEVDSAQLECYKAILKEEIDTSICLEPGGLTLYAVSDQKKPTVFTIIETYASIEPYQSHLKSPQFIEYKITTEKIVKSLELLPCDRPIALGKNKIDYANI